jgi:hypothetical protein
MRIRFWCTGQMKDLDNREALVMRPPGHPDHSSSLINLANSTRIHYNQTGHIEDPEGAIIRYRDALNLLPPKHPNRSICPTNHGIRFDQMEDLEEAIVNQGSALALRLPEHPNRSMSLFNLGSTTRTRFRETGQMRDLEEAIPHYRNALVSLPSGHPCRPTCLNDLATVMTTCLST